MSKLKAECQQWKGKFEGEGLIAADELENERQRRILKKIEIIDATSEITLKISNCEKLINKLVKVFLSKLKFFFFLIVFINYYKL